jgi:hypothetical protein
MRSSLRGLVLAVAIVALAAAVATAEKQVKVEPLGAVAAKPINLGPSLAAGTCQVGNLNAAFWAIGNFLMPPEDYKLVFYPKTTCPGCRSGFNVTNVHIVLQTHDACTLVMSVDVEKTERVEPGCFAPGPLVCESGLYQVNVPSSGVWIIGIPVSDCGCLSALGGPYCLSVHFESMSCTSGGVDLATDVGPGALCLNWNNYGTGWYDLFEEVTGWPGQLNIYADVSCCNAAKALTAPQD